MGVIVYNFSLFPYVVRPISPSSSQRNIKEGMDAFSYSVTTMQSFFVDLLLCSLPLDTDDLVEGLEFLEEMETCIKNI